MDCCSDDKNLYRCAYVWSSFNFFKILFVLFLKLHILFFVRITKSDMDCVIHQDLTVTFHDQK